MHRKLFSILSMLVFGLFHGVMAHATPITAPIAAGTYNLSDASIRAGDTAYSLTGTITIGSNGLMTAADVTLNDPNLGNPVFNVIGNTGDSGYNPVANFAYITTTGNTAQLDLSYLTTLNASGNIDLCVHGSNCNGYQASTAQFYSSPGFGNDPVHLSGGSFDPTPAVIPAPAPAVTPEPASLLLLATGILALAGLFWKRAMRA